MCEKCKLVRDFYLTTDKSDAAYFYATELFVFLHKGNDFCDIEKFKQNLTPQE